MNTLVEAWCYIPVISTLGGQEQKYYKCKASLGFRVRP